MEAFFLDGQRGPLFCILHPATDHQGSKFGLVFLPPFAEEMNRCRRMASLQARRLARLGIDVLLLDTFGTGDSAGDFSEARWEIWRDDAKRAVEWLGARCSGRVGLWGVRLGALLAAEITAEPDSRVERLLLWQPVLSGDRHLTQFLRLRVAAGMVRGSRKETVKDLRARLSQGESLEIAGYELTPALAEAIVSRKLADLLAHSQGVRLDLLEVANSEYPALTPATQQLLETLERQSQPHSARAVSGEPFWSIQEITVAPGLLQATEELLRS
jgi:exosortase A-associated hydrolase 2